MAHKTIFEGVKYPNYAALYRELLKRVDNPVHVSTFIGRMHAGATPLEAIKKRDKDTGRGVDSND